jgi:hypothetical protein
VRDPFVRSVVLKRDDVDFNCSPFSIPAIRNLSESELDPHVTLIAGDTFRRRLRRTAVSDRNDCRGTVRGATWTTEIVF